jgi:GNAT superfamily N-acetyltransferase
LTSEIAIRKLELGDVASCESVLRSLPDWFGIEQSVQDYVESLKTLPGFVAIVDGDVVGFIATKQHTPDAAELYVMAVRRELHRTGIGRRLVEAAETQLRGQSKLFQVKTLGPSHPDEGYSRTRGFYLSLGFIPLEETDAFWGPENPCLLLVKPLAPG